MTSTESSGERLYALLFPYGRHQADLARRNNQRFVYYTNAETAFRILTGGQIWMRNAITMNDFSEIAHGTKCLATAWNDPQAGGVLKFALDRAHKGLSEDIQQRFNTWLPSLQDNTYLTCISEHPQEEDAHGRLSMWRAYGGRNGVALVLRNTPFLTPSDELGASSSPVLYADEYGFTAAFAVLARNIAEHGSILAELMYEQVLANVFQMLKYAVLCTKHPGFCEEREWRIIYTPDLELSSAITLTVEVVNGVPQPVAKLPLVDAPERGLHAASIPLLLDRLIIGPTDEPRPIYQALSIALEKAGVDNPEARIVVSGIPLRH